MSDSVATELQPGEILYREGDRNEYAYIIESGELMLHNSATGQRIDCERRGAGSIVGELSVVMDKPRAVTAEATVPTRVFRVSANQIMRRFDQLDPLLQACVKTSIHFIGNFNTRMLAPAGEVPEAPTTLSGATEVIERLKFEEDILVGLERDEFSMVYQPIVRLPDGEITGFEALMRWQHPELGFVPPFRFIEAAETMGSVGRLTQFALTEACAALRRFEQSGLISPDTYVSVNISGKDIVEESFADFVAHTLDSSGVAPTNLKLEMTETALVADPEAAAKQLHRLRDLGCGISIDDFGTGYSNLAYLKKLPFTTLKIDRAFAGDAHSDAVSRSIVKMLVGLGNDMQVDIVAEGLETPDDVATLSGLGCAYAQGYHFCKPQPEGAIAEMLGQTQVADRVA